MFSVTRLCLVVLLFLAAAIATADSAIRLTTFPSISVADGKSTVTVTAEVRDQNGRMVADGTRVVFSSTLGEFRETFALTSGGYAHGILRAGSISGIAKITAKALSGDSPPSTIEFEFVKDRSDLNSAKEYIEVVAPTYMQYAVDKRLLAAAGQLKTPGAKGGVALRYREITITAEDLQLNIPTYEVRARRARLKMGTMNQYFDELYFKLNIREGYGTTTYLGKRSSNVVTLGHGLAFVSQAQDGSYKLPIDEPRYGMVEVSRSGFIPLSTSVSSLFYFEDIGDSPSTVSAKKAIIYPRKEIQFQKAQIFVASTKIISLPLYVVSFTGLASPVVTDTILTVNNSQVGLNFPYYIALKPGLTELLRFRTGELYGRTVTSDSGAFLDYELSWNKGDDMQGGFAFQGIGRDDWTVTANQYIRINDQTSASAQVASPTFRSYYGSGSVSEQFKGFSASLTGSATRTVTGLDYFAQNYAVVLEKDPIKVGSLPIRLYPGVTAETSTNSLDNKTQSGAGARLRAQTLPLKIDKTTTLTASLQTSYLKGPNELPGLQYLGSVALNKNFTAYSSLLLSYDFTRDGFNEYVLGEHRLSAQANYSRGNLNLTLFGSRSLDLERSSVFGDASYRLSKLWRLTASYTFDKYLSDTYVDYTFGFGYRLGWKEVGLIWSEQTKRIGFQLLGVTVY